MLEKLKFRNVISNSVYLKLRKKNLKIKLQ